MAILNQPPKHCLGCDVAKDEIVIASHDKITTIRNRPRSIRAFLADNDAELIVCEPTGGYERHLMTEALRFGLAVHRADTLKVKSFIRSYGTLGKSDAIDARGLALYGQERWKSLNLWEPAGEAYDKLRALVRRRSELIAAKVAEQNRAKATHDKDIAASCKTMLAIIIRQIEAMDRRIEAVIETCSELRHKVDVCVAMDGIAKRTATAIIAIMPELGTLNRRQAAALAGLAPHPNESGTAIKRRTTKGGRPEIARALFMPALRAAQQKGEFADFYKRLTKTNNKKPIVAITAVMRKIIITLNARLKDATNAQS